MVSKRDDCRFDSHLEMIYTFYFSCFVSFSCLGRRIAAMEFDTQHEIERKLGNRIVLKLGSFCLRKKKQCRLLLGKKRDGAFETLRDERLN